MSEAPIPGLHWGIKASFIEYIARMPDGKGSVSAGATATEGNIMVFAPAPDALPSEAHEFDAFWAFRGDVRFGGHVGMLYVRIADPWITVRAGQGQLSVLDPYTPDTKPRLPLATFTLDRQNVAGDLDTWLATDVRLTQEGTGLFNDVYQAGEEFEPLAIFWPAPTPTL